MAAAAERHGPFLNSIFALLFQGLSQRDAELLSKTAVRIDAGTGKLDPPRSIHRARYGHQFSSGLFRSAVSKYRAPIVYPRVGHGRGTGLDRSSRSTVPDANCIAQHGP